MVKVLEVKSKKPIKEATIQRKIKHYLEAEGVTCEVTTVTAYGKRGVADIVGCTSTGQFIAVEVKRPGGRLTVLQRQYLKEKRDHGGIAIMATSVDDLIDQLMILGAKL